MSAKNANLMPMNAIASDLFTWNGSEGCVELSDLGRNYPFERIYRDACDEGLAVQSSRSGKVERFYVADRLRDAEGEFVAYRLKPVSSELEARGVSLLIFND